MTDLPTLRGRAIEAASQSLCLHHFTDGFCGGHRSDCELCSRLGAQVGVDVLRHIRPTLLRLLLSKGQLPLTVKDVVDLIDEAVG